jgi:hypothetical protein
MLLLGAEIPPVAASHRITTMFIAQAAGELAYHYFLNKK